MGQWLAKSWFLLALLVLLPGGMTWGWVTSEGWRMATAGHVHPAITTTIILFLMSFSLDSGKLRESFLPPRAVIWGAVVNLGLLPLLAWPLAMTHALPDFSLGLMIAAAVPCTLATASVFTRQAGGNDAVSLQVTLLTNTTAGVAPVLNGPARSLLDALPTVEFAIRLYNGCCSM